MSKRASFLALPTVAFVLFVAGAIMLVATVYQERVPTELSPEDYHMSIPTETYVVRSLNVAATSAGVAFILVGAVLVAYWLLKVRHGTAKPKDQKLPLW